MFGKVVMGVDIPNGLASSALLEFIISLDSQEEKQEALFLASGQAHLPTSAQRPVIILVSVVDTAQTTTIGESRGYVTGYDVLANKLIIKPFHSNDERHFLADKWSPDDLPTDGISFSGTPAEFIKDFHNFATNTPSSEKGDTLNAQGPKFLVWTDVAAWLHQDRPFIFDAALKDPHLDGSITPAAFTDAFKSLRKTFKDVPFPIQKKEAEGEEKVKDELDLEVGHFKGMVEAAEWHLREAAVEAKERGKGGKAEGAARMYGKVVEALREFEMGA